MPPKRKAGGTKAKAGGKKVKVDTKAGGEPTVRDAIAALKKAGSGKKVFAVDKLCPISANSDVHEDYDCMLNQTNIGHNNNKYYIIQVLIHRFNGQFYAWNRWGRVGENGANALKGPMSEEDAIKEFCKKFSDKTKNKWDNRKKFTPAAGKYTLIEVEGTDETDMAETSAKLAALDEVDSSVKVAPCTLEKPTQNLLSLIFDQDMFNEAMKSYDIDVKKMPLGKLSKVQIAKGFECLEEIQKAIEKKKSVHSELVALTSKFYTLIPHDFGRQRPPIITTMEVVRAKMDMLLVLADIELAQAMQKDKKKAPKKKAESTKPHPLDEKYEMLNTNLTLLNKKSEEFKIIETYLENTKGYYNNLKLQNVWTVDRAGEGDRFSVHDKIGNRKLLWHGTNVAVVAAIMKSGLRIMPHSGGRVGSGIYFASENGKSAGYVSPAKRTGIMFLNEVVLGKEHHITKDQWTLKSAPKGHDSVIAKGWTEPDPKKDTSLTIDGKNIIVPQGKPIKQSKYDSKSSFSQSEYLIYKESQCRIRYMLALTF
ncbi:unnamed protein product [Owenia fusiformis]|uniref:Uncharacterized protein n=1 Tax=Owenia fusiformis TaxID=6347 RepID=A0A8J1U092_OWEFU|nr:unnamed protein product [Owenia fusiformis]